MESRIKFTNRSPRHSTLLVWRRLPLLPLLLACHVTMAYVAVTSRANRKGGPFLYSKQGNGVNDDPSALVANDDDGTTYFSPNVPLRPNDWMVDDEQTHQDTPSNDNENSSINEYSFFDEATIYVRAGSGGQGSSTYKKLNKHSNQNGPPDGGNGGNGGSVVLLVDPSLNTLAGLTQAWRPNSFGGSGTAYTASASNTRGPKSFRAENGIDGARQFRNGRSGKDTIIRVPPGTVIEEQVVTTEEEKESWIRLGSLTEPGQEMVVAVGGQGGEGTAVQGKNRGVKRPRVPPQGGERKTLRLTLKVVADVALVGVPNAGKSTFLAAVTRAKPKIANYPFTTVIPNLGVWIPSYDEQNVERGAGSNGLILCDVPGLIAGASQGVGLGHAFLRHVERCHVILHLVDATSDNPVADFQMLNKEIIKYGTGQLATMPQVVVINKVDAFDDDASTTEDWEKGLKVKYTRKELEEEIKRVMPHSRLLWMSAKEREGVDNVMERLAGFVQKVKAEKMPV